MRMVPKLDQYDTADDCGMEQLYAAHLLDRWGALVYVMMF